MVHMFLYATSIQQQTLSALPSKYIPASNQFLPLHSYSSAPAINISPGLLSPTFVPLWYTLHPKHEKISWNVNQSVSLYVQNPLITSWLIQSKSLSTYLATSSASSRTTSPLLTALWKQWLPCYSSNMPHALPSQDVCTRCSSWMQSFSNTMALSFSSTMAPFSPPPLPPTSRMMLPYQNQESSNLPLTLLAPLTLLFLCISYNQRKYICSVHFSYHLSSLFLTLSVAPSAL